MYIDEVGNSDLGASADPNHRYLSLTGVIMSLDLVNAVAHPRVEDLKRRHFGSHADDPVVFHRKELVNKRSPFEALKDPNVEKVFNDELLDLLEVLEYSVVTVIIDKLEHNNKYGIWKADPYHYCLEILVERYVLWLRGKKVLGDVMAESRGRKEDMRLKRSFRRLCEKGTGYITAADIMNYLSSRELKVKSKSNNICGLQIADLIAHPSFRGALARKENKPLPDNFGGRIVQILEAKKYHRNPSGSIDGYGRKWLP